MKDEYGEMNADGETFLTTDFVLENKSVLPEAQLRYQTYGTLNPEKDNVLVVCHALTGNASLHAWWGDLLGSGKPFDTSKYFVVCCNILGSCYGSTSPQSVDPRTGSVYGKSFPDISVQDTVRLQLLMLKRGLGISSVKSVIGGSFGGMQALEFAVQAGSKHANFRTEEGKVIITRKIVHERRNLSPLNEGSAALCTVCRTLKGSPFVRSVVPIACGAAHTAWQIGISEVQRQAIYADPHWDRNGFEATKGLEIARQLGMISYRTPRGYQGKFGRQLRSDDSPKYGSNASWQVKSYLEYQGLKFKDRFDPITYVKMTEQMDSHDISRNRAASVEEVLRSLEIEACILGIDSDVLYPLSEQEELAREIPKSNLKIIHSNDGHDGFLLEQSQVAKYIVDFLGDS
jgi:homoserine O-acetyltransferase/O-succinyltransferase